MTALAAAEAELVRRERQAPKPLTPEQQSQILKLGVNLDVVFSAPSTTDRDRKELLGTLLADVTINIDRAAGHADLVLRWKGGAITDLTVPLIARPQDRLRTDEDTIDRLRRLAVHYPDAQIAGILNRQKRSTAIGLAFTAGRVQSLRHHWNIDCHLPQTLAEGTDRVLTIVEAADQLRLPAQPCTVGSARDSSTPTNSPPARPAGSASPSRSGPSSSTRPPTGGSRCSKPPTATN